MKMQSHHSVSILQQPGTSENSHIRLYGFHMPTLQGSSLVQAERGRLMSGVVCITSIQV